MQTRPNARWSRSATVISQKHLVPYLQGMHVCMHRYRINSTPAMQCPMPIDLVAVTIYYLVVNCMCVRRITWYVRRITWVCQVHRIGVVANF